MVKIAPLRAGADRLGWCAGVVSMSCVRLRALRAGADRLGWCAGVALILSLGLGPRAVAQLGARSAEEWLKTLDSAPRVAKLKVDEVLAVLNVLPGSVVADIGAGSGIFTWPLAKAVGGGGRVYAVDIEKGLVERLARRAGEEKMPHVQAVLGEFTDPKLPAKEVDLAFIFDVLHHIENRAEYLKNLAQYLKAKGRIAVIDFHPELGPHKNDPALQVTKDQARAWLAAMGFKPVEEYPLFTDKWFVVYAR